MRRRARLARQQVVLLVDEEALGIGHEVVADWVRRRPMPFEPVRSSTPGRRSECRRGGSYVRDLRDVVEPLAEPFPFGVGVERDVGVGLLRGFHRRVPSLLTRQAVDVGRAADHEELDIFHALGSGLVDRHDFGLEVRPEAVGDVVGHDVRVAVHRFVDDECSHGSSMRRSGRGA